MGLIVCGKGVSAFFWGGVTGTPLWSVVRTKLQSWARKMQQKAARLANSLAFNVFFGVAGGGEGGGEGEGVRSSWGLWDRAKSLRRRRSVFKDFSGAAQNLPGHRFQLRVFGPPIGVECLAGAVAEMLGSPRWDSRANS